MSFLNCGLKVPAQRSTRRSNEASAASNCHPSFSSRQTSCSTLSKSTRSSFTSGRLTIAAMFDRPDSSLTRTRRELPTKSGLMCSYDFVDLAIAWTCMPPLWANALAPTYGCPGRYDMFAVSYTKRDSSVRCPTPPASPCALSRTTVSGIFNARLAATEMISALPQRSPMPLMVP